MKLYASIVKSFKEVIRDWKVLGMVLVFAPVFVLLMKLYYGGGPTTYQVGILNLDSGKQASELVQDIEATTGEGNEKILEVSFLMDQTKLEKEVENKQIDIGIVIPENYSEKLLNRAAGKNIDPAIVQIYGSLSNAKYMVAAVLANDAVYRKGMDIAEITLPSGIKETFLEKQQVVNEFDATVPGLISFSVLMMLFTATASIVKENDNGTLVRLKMSRLGSLQFLSGICIVQTVVAVLAIIITYWISLLLGFKPAGSFLSVLVVGILSGLSMVAMSLIVASFLNTLVDVLTIGCLPFFIFMFFSGCMFPIPKTTLFTVAGKSFGITDILSLTHSSAAFNKILNYGAGLTDISYEMSMITILTIIYFIIGVFLYQRLKLSKA